MPLTGLASVTEYRSHAPFLPDLEDVAQDAVVNLEPATKAPEAYLAISGSTTKQHKATIFRIFSSRCSVAKSRDRLKRVRGFSRRNEAAANSSGNPNDAIPGDPMVLVDPTAIRVRSNGFTWLAVVIISGISCGTKQVETLPKRLLGEPNSVGLVAIAASMELATRSTKDVPVIAFGSSFPYRTTGGFACFVCNREGSSLEQDEGLCVLCPSASLSFTSPAKLVEHMAIHMLFDQNPPINREAGPCGFCLSTNSFCTILLIKTKGSDGAVRIDMARSRCPNLANLGLATAANSQEESLY
ncbi:hypothetical protein B0H13DRAFT_1922524 [Mycena leptocephala]|nr:hypothetical protein B0H13DRAFT_1922524 [Mycena leptocephala]